MVAEAGRKTTAGLEQQVSKLRAQQASLQVGVRVGVGVVELHKRRLFIVPWTESGLFTSKTHILIVFLF
jgi:hypothetical protein